jgi:hypothetical protein
MSDSAFNNPKKTRGKPFERGNNAGKGRPSGSRNKTTLAVDRLLDGQAEAITQKCVALALDGDRTALRLAMERIAPLRKGRPVTFALPPIKNAEGLTAAIGAVAEAMSRGEVSPDEASAIASVLDLKRRAIETVEIERRLSQLEGAQANTR